MRALGEDDSRGPSNKEIVPSNHKRLISEAIRRPRDRYGVESSASLGVGLGSSLFE